MKLSAEDQRRLTLATALALEWHAEQTRKRSEIPYASHLLQVCGLVLEHGGDVDQAAAALLHDALEDAPSSTARRAREGRIEVDLGADVLRMVRDATDTEEHEHLGEKAPWHDRKTRFLAHLPHADPRSHLVVACDKRHNLGALVEDVRLHGRSYMDRFTGEAEDQVWYFEEVLKAVAGHVPPRLEQELRRLVEELRELLGRGEPAPDVAVP